MGVTGSHMTQADSSCIFPFMAHKLIGICNDTVCLVHEPHFSKLEGSLCLLRTCLTLAFIYFERFRLTCKVDGPRVCMLARMAYTQLTQ